MLFSSINLEGHYHNMAFFDLSGALIPHETHVVQQKIQNFSFVISSDLGWVLRRMF